MMRFVISALFICFVVPSYGALIIKVKNKRALIHLEGMSLKSGSYVQVMDLYGKSQGLMKIKRVGEKKAIGILQLGKMKTRWALEPEKKRVASKALKKVAKKRKLALKKSRKKMTRGLASVSPRKKPKRSLASASPRKKMKRGLASLMSPRKKPKRKLAAASHKKQKSSDEGEYLVDDYQGGASYYGEEYNSTGDDSKGFGDFNLKVGSLGQGKLDFMKLQDEHNRSLIKGFGYGGQLFVEVDLNDVVALKIQGGYKKFNAASQDSCAVDSKKDCELQVDYIMGGLGLKLILLENERLQLWGGLEGNLNYPIRFLNRASLTPESFGLHGDMGLSIGTDILIGPLSIPISLTANLFMPPTATVLANSLSLNLGWAWMF